MTIMLLLEFELRVIKNPTVETLAKIAKALDVKADDLIKKQYEPTINTIFKNKN